MEHTCVQPLRCGDRRLRRLRHARPDRAIDLILDCRDGAFAQLQRRQSRPLLDERVTVDPFTHHRRLVAITPIPVLADANVLEIAAALDVEKRRPPIAMGLFGRAKGRASSLNYGSSDAHWVSNDAFFYSRPSASQPFDGRSAQT